MSRRIKSTGVRPVEKDVVVTCRLRNGQVVTAPARLFDWNIDQDNLCPSDIVLWRKI